MVRFLNNSLQILENFLISIRSSTRTSRLVSTSNELPAIVDNNTDLITSDTSSSTAETTVQSPSPTYLGYLSGVFTTLWSNTPFWSTSAKKTSDIKPTTAVRFAIRPQRAEINARTSGLVKKLILAESPSSRLLRTEEVCTHLLQYPQAQSVAVKDRLLISTLLHYLKTSKDDALQSKIRECLSLCGYVNPPRGHGICILAIDGGGTRGMMGLEVLDALEAQCNGRNLCDMFDHIVGVSTGGIIAALLVAHRLPVRECKVMYKELSRQLFNQGKLSGVRGLLLDHSYYNSKKWIEMLKSAMGIDKTVLDTCRLINSPKLSIISCMVNAPQLQPFIFRNYEHPVGRDSHYSGGCGHKMWQALQATSAAPGYFEEVCLANMLHQDGGVLVNNPTAVALHEARLLWPNEQIQCLISVGNGRTSVKPFAIPEKAPASTSIQEKMLKIVDSATDTESVHIVMNDLLPMESYFRLNPYMSLPYTLDEIDPIKLRQMEVDAQLYVRRNARKIQSASSRLLEQRTIMQQIRDQFEYQKALRGFYSSQ